MIIRDGKADELCERVAFLNKGHIVELGSPNDLKLKYAKDSIDILFHDGSSVNVKKDSESLIELLKDNDKKILSIHSKEPNLAEIFLSLTGRDLK